MNRYFILGLFALLMVVVSFWRLMADREFFRLTSMKKAWGRRRGLAMHFLCNVGLPLVIGIVFLSHGVVGFTPGSPVGSGGSYHGLDLQAVAKERIASARQQVYEYGNSETGLCP